MPVDPSIIAGGAALAGELANAAFAGARNRRARKDAVDFWNMQNDYNSPEKQMQRFEAAGLNPNLIYGNGTSTTAGAIQAPSVEQTRVNPGKVLSAYQDATTRKLQNDNLKAQNTNMLEQANLIKAQTLATLKGADIKDFDLTQKVRLADNQADLLSENVRKLKTGTDISLQENERRALLSAQSLEKGIQAIMNMKIQRAKMENERAVLVQQMKKVEQEFENLSRSGELQKFEIELRRQGVTSQDDLWQRIAAKLLGRLGISF